MADDRFQLADNPNLVGLWEFSRGSETSDTATTADGIAQDGTLAGDAAISGGTLRLAPGQTDDYFNVDGDNGGPEESVFDIDFATVMVRFNQSVHNGGVNPDIIVSRGESDDQSTEGVFQIRVTLDGRVEVAHRTPVTGTDSVVLLATTVGFFEPGDDVEVTYAFNSATGASLRVVNHTTQVTQDLSTPTTGMTLNIGDNDGEIFTFGAGESVDDVYSGEFSGTIGYVAVFNEDLITNPPPPPPIVVLPDGIVDGTTGDDVIDLAYDGDPEGDLIDANDSIFAGGGDADIVLAGRGNDTVESGRGDDLVIGGDGDDVLNGELDADIIIGDGPNLIQTFRESFEWDLLGAPDGADVLAFEQVTGFVTVNFSVASADGGTFTRFSSDTQRTAGIDTGDETISNVSSLESSTTGDGQSVTYQLEFSQLVDNVSFRINGVDGGARVKVTAFDDLGNPVNVDLSGAPAVSLSDTDGLFGVDTAQSGGPVGSDDSSTSSVLVDIPANVSRILIEHDQFNGTNADINITDVYYDVTADVGARATANLIVNGSFEDVSGMDPQAYGWKGDVLPGWQIGGRPGAEVDVHNDARGDLDATDGSKWLDLSERSDDTLVFQDIAINPDDKYVLSFDAGDAPLGDNGLEVFWNGELVRTLTPADIPDGSFATFRLVLAGDSGDGSGRLAFGGTGPADLIGASLDNVAMFAVSGSQGTGDDTLIGGRGDDVLFGGGGDDTFELGAFFDSDEAYGGDGQDSFSQVWIGDYVEGGEGGVDNDTLDLTGISSNFTVEFDPTDSEAGTVTYFNPSGSVSGRSRFTEIENVIICFTPGSMVETEFGLRPVEAIRPGDRVWTRDNGLQEVRWASRSDLSADDLAARPHLAPVLIRKGSLGENLPERDMVVSPNHRMLIESTDAALYFAEPEVLAAAKHLVDGKGVIRARVPQVSYIHFMFDQHEVVRVDGAWSESFQPGDYSLNGLDAEQRGEILELFPDLATDQGLQDYQAARLSLKKHEARLLLA